MGGRSHVLIRRRTAAEDEGIPPLLRTTRDGHALPPAGFRFAFAKRASGEGRPGRAVLVQLDSEVVQISASASLRERRCSKLRPMASSHESTSCLSIGCDGFGRVALLVVVLADSAAPARQQRVRAAPRRGFRKSSIAIVRRASSAARKCGSLRKADATLAGSDGGSPLLTVFLNACGVRDGHLRLQHNRILHGRVRPYSLLV